MTRILLVCHRPSISGIGRLEEDGTLAQELDVDPMAVVHTETAGMEFAVDVGLDLNSSVPHSRIHRRIDRDHDSRIDLGCALMLEVAGICDSL